jgi:hypothetical protein
MFSSFYLPFFTLVSPLFFLINLAQVRQFDEPALQRQVVQLQCCRQHSGSKAGVGKWMASENSVFGER